MRRAAVVVFTALLGLSFGGGAARAATGASAKLGFSIAAAHSPRWFVLALRPGQVSPARLIVRNTSGQRKQIVLAPTDAITAAAGGYAFAPAPPKRTGGWLTLSRRSVTLPPHSAVSVGFTVAVPAGAPGGEHFAGITAVDEARVKTVDKERATRHRRPSVLVLTRAGIAVQIDLPGPTVRRLAVTGAGLTVSPSGPSVTVDMANAGNRLIPQTKVDLVVARAAKTMMRSSTSLGSFLTDSNLSYLLPWQGTIGPGRYHLTGWVRPQDGPPVRIDRTVTVGGAAVRKLRQQSRVATVPVSHIPTLIILVLAAAAVLILGMGYALVRSRRGTAVG